MKVLHSHLIVTEHGNHDKENSTYTQYMLVGVACLKGKYIFGLCDPYEPGVLTHMSYYLNDGHFNPKEVIEKIEDYFYFDAGNSGHFIRVTKDELTRAFKKLVLLED